MMLGTMPIPIILSTTVLSDLVDFITMWSYVTRIGSRGIAVTCTSCTAGICYVENHTSLSHSLTTRFWVLYRTTLLDSFGTQAFPVYAVRYCTRTRRMPITQIHPLDITLILHKQQHILQYSSKHPTLLI